MYGPCSSESHSPPAVQGDGECEAAAIKSVLPPSGSQRQPCGGCAQHSGGGKSMFTQVLSPKA